MKDNRPINLDISTIKLPITAYVSILHRVSGVAVFFGIAILLCLLDLSLESASSFGEVKIALQDSFFLRATVWLIVSILIYHTVAGVKHLAMDIGFGETLNGGKISSKLVFMISLILMLSKFLIISETIKNIKK